MSSRSGGKINLLLIDRESFGQTPVRDNFQWQTSEVFSPRKIFSYQCQKINRKGAKAQRKVKSKLLSFAP